MALANLNDKAEVYRKYGKKLARNRRRPIYIIKTATNGLKPQKQMNDKTFYESISNILSRQYVNDRIQAEYEGQKRNKQYSKVLEQLYQFKMQDGYKQSSLVSNSKDNDSSDEESSYLKFQVKASVQFANEFEARLLPDLIEPITECLSTYREKIQDHESKLQEQKDIIDEQGNRIVRLEGQLAEARAEIAELKKLNKRPSKSTH